MERPFPNNTILSDIFNITLCFLMILVVSAGFLISFDAYGDDIESRELKSAVIYEMVSDNNKIQTPTYIKFNNIGNKIYFHKAISLADLNEYINSLGGACPKKFYFVDINTSYIMNLLEDINLGTSCFLYYPDYEQAILIPRQ
jgi:hypothetical protein